MKKKKRGNHIESVRTSNNFMLFLLTSYFFRYLNEQIIRFLVNNKVEKIFLVSKLFFDRREHYYGYNRMVKNQSGSCNFIYLMIIKLLFISYQYFISIWIRYPFSALVLVMFSHHLVTMIMFKYSGTSNYRISAR